MFRTFGKRITKWATFNEPGAAMGHAHCALLSHLPPPPTHTHTRHPLTRARAAPPTGVCSFAGFVYGSFPPGKVASIAGCGRHMLNMLRAHTHAYACMCTRKPVRARMHTHTYTHILTHTHTHTYIHTYTSTHA